MGRPVEAGSLTSRRLCTTTQDSTRGYGESPLVHPSCPPCLTPIWVIPPQGVLIPSRPVRARAQESIRGCDVFLVQPSCPPVNDHLMELLVMIDACKRASARSITAVIPYYGYARADRKTQGRESIAAKLTANLLTEAGAWPLHSWVTRLVP